MAEGAFSVSLLGTGLMGAGMGRSLLRAGARLTVWNRSAERTTPLAEAGAAVAATAADAVAASAVVVTMLSDGAATRDVMAGALAAAAPGTAWLQMGTVGTAATDELARLAARSGVAFVDAPVLGTREPAERGELVVVASGPAQVRAAADPVFNAVGRRTVWLGDGPGAASALKLCVNAYLDATLVALAESLRLTEALGLAPERFLEAIAGGATDSPLAQGKGRMMLDGRFTPPSFPLSLAYKDLRLVLEAAQEAGAELTVAPVAAGVFARAEALGRGRDDMAAVCTAFGLARSGRGA